MPVYVKRPPPEPTFQAVQFTGANAADVTALGAEFQATPDGLLVTMAAHPFGQRLMQETNWVIALPGGDFLVMDDEDFQAAYALKQTK